MLWQISQLLVEGLYLFAVRNHKFRIVLLDTLLEPHQLDFTKFAFRLCHRVLYRLFSLFFPFKILIHQLLSQLFFGKFGFWIFLYCLGLNQRFESFQFQRTANKTHLIQINII